MEVGVVAVAEGMLRESFDALRCAAAGPAASTDDLVGVLRFAAAAEREAQRVTVEAVAAMLRQGVFAQHGQRPHTALCALLGIEAIEARRIVLAAEQACPRVDLHGQVLPPLLPATAAAFDAGAASLRHVDVIARLMAGPAARRLPLHLQGDVEAQIAEKTGEYTPSELRSWGAGLIEMLDQDGAEPDDQDPDEVNDLLLSHNPDGSGGRIRGRFSAALYDVIAAILDAKAAPLTADDTRPIGQRQAEAMAEVFGYVADHADSSVVPTTGGERPHVNVLIRLDDLENRARAAMLDFGGTMSPAEFRMLCCDACVIPVVMNGVGQPLDVGRRTRVVPEGLRRAVAARDRGCAHPGCDRTASWSEIHHIRPWAQGGETALNNLVILCRIHHREMHSSEWIVRIASDGLPEFYPPTWMDSQQRPRRKPLPHLSAAS